MWPCRCVNNTLALHNTEMLRQYSALDARFRSLVFLIKYWARRRKAPAPCPVPRALCCLCPTEPAGIRRVRLRESPLFQLLAPL